MAAKIRGHSIKHIARSLRQLQQEDRKKMSQLKLVDERLEHELNGKLTKKYDSLHRKRILLRSQCRRQMKKLHMKKLRLREAMAVKEQERFELLERMQKLEQQQQQRQMQWKKLMRWRRRCGMSIRRCQNVLTQLKLDRKAVKRELEEKERLLYIHKKKLRKLMRSRKRKYREQIFQLRHSAELLGCDLQIAKKRRQNLNQRRAEYKQEMKRQMQISVAVAKSIARGKQVQPWKTLRRLMAVKRIASEHLITPSLNQLMARKQQLQLEQTMQMQVRSNKIQETDDTEEFDSEKADRNRKRKDATKDKPEEQKKKTKEDIKFQKQTRANGSEQDGKARKPIEEIDFETVKKQFINSTKFNANRKKAIKGREGQINSSADKHTEDDRQTTTRRLKKSHSVGLEQNHQLAIDSETSNVSHFMQASNDHKRCRSKLSNKAKQFGVLDSDISVQIAVKDLTHEQQTTDNSRAASDEGERHRELFLGDMAKSKRKLSKTKETKVDRISEGEKRTAENSISELNVSHAEPDGEQKTDRSEKVEEKQKSKKFNDFDEFGLKVDAKTETWICKSNTELKKEDGGIANFEKIHTSYLRDAYLETKELHEIMQEDDNQRKEAEIQELDNTINEIMKRVSYKQPEYDQEKYYSYLREKLGKNKVKSLMKNNAKMRDSALLIKYYDYYGIDDDDYENVDLLDDVEKVQLLGSVLNQIDLLCNDTSISVAAVATRKEIKETVAATKTEVESSVSQKKNRKFIEHLNELLKYSNQEDSKAKAEIKTKTRQRKMCKAKKPRAKTKQLVEDKLKVDQLDIKEPEKIKRVCSACRMFMQASDDSFRLQRCRPLYIHKQWI